jgi:alkylation response protein AidB-like acyl-CoA dehydrogenase
MGEDGATEIPMAEHLTEELANRVTHGAVPTSGGYGHMREFPVERVHRGARLWAIGGGPSEVMKGIVAKRLGFWQR